MSGDLTGLCLYTHLVCNSDAKLTLYTLSNRLKVRYLEITIVITDHSTIRHMIGDINTQLVCDSDPYCILCFQISQEYVSHYEGSGRFLALEASITHLEVTSLDIHQVLKVEVRVNLFIRYSYPVLHNLVLTYFMLL